MTISLLAATLICLAPSPKAADRPGPAQERPVLLAQAGGGKPDCEPADEDKKMLEDLEKARIYFDFNDDRVRADDRNALERFAKWLKKQPKLKITINGNTDERGSTEYNLALGERRAASVRKYWGDLGVAPEQLNIISYGEERPAKEGHDEASWAANRRSQFTWGGKLLKSNVGPNGQCDEDNANAANTDDADKDKDQDKDKNKGKVAQKSSDSDGKGRMFPWLPIWVGPVVAALGVPGLLLGLPFLASVVYLGPSVWSAPNACAEPVSVSSGSPVLTSGASPANWCGSAWSVAQHSNERQLAGPMLGAGIAGWVVSTVIGVALIGAGVGLTVAALIPGGGEKADADAADGAPQDR